MTKKPQSLVTQLIKSFREQGTDDAKAVVEIFKLNKASFECALTGLTASCSLTEVIKTILDKSYTDLPNPDAVDCTVKYLRDRYLDSAQQLHKNYWTAQQFLLLLKRTDITDDERLYAFVQTHNAYNKIFDIISRNAADEARKSVAPPPYEIA